MELSLGLNPFKSHSSIEAFKQKKLLFDILQDVELGDMFLTEEDFDTLRESQNINIEPRARKCTCCIYENYSLRFVFLLLY